MSVFGVFNRQLVQVKDAGEQLKVIVCWVEQADEGAVVTVSGELGFQFSECFDFFVWFWWGFY